MQNQLSRVYQQKKIKRTTWQQFQNEFAATTEGKKAFRCSPAEFMKAASEAYKELEDDARSHCQASMRITEKVVSIKDIKKEGGEGGVGIFS